jgi:hypothetical protein
MSGKHVVFGRCRSGRRWFWVAIDLDYYYKEQKDHLRLYGWEDREEAASAAARAAAEGLANQLGSVAKVGRAGYAAVVLKELNAEKRRQRPAATTSDSKTIEYLYGESYYEGFHLHEFRVTKKTTKRIYYIRRQYQGRDPEIGFVDRQELEAKGEVRNRGVHWSSNDSVLYSAPPTHADHNGPPPSVSRQELYRLKMAMAAAHPDHGGNDKEFIAAHERYLRAKGGASS